MIAAKMKCPERLGPIIRPDRPRSLRVDRMLRVLGVYNKACNVKVHRLHAKLYYFCVGHATSDGSPDLLLQDLLRLQRRAEDVGRRHLGVDSVGVDRQLLGAG